MGHQYEVSFKRISESRTEPGSVREPGRENDRGRSDAADWVREKLGFCPDEALEQVLASRSHRGILNCTRQWGKSTVTAAKAVHQAYTEGGSLTLVVSPSARQSGEFVRKAEGFAQRLGIRPKSDGENEMSLEFPNGSRIIGLPGNEATIRGFSAVSLLLVDEASRVSDDLYMAIPGGRAGDAGREAKFVHPGIDAASVKRGDDKGGAIGWSGRGKCAVEREGNGAWRPRHRMSLVRL
jgi:hypothetical protein